MPDDTAMSSARMAEPIEMPFGLWTRVGPSKRVLGGVHTGVTNEPSMYAVDAAFLSNYFDHLFYVFCVLYEFVLTDEFLPRDAAMLARSWES